MSITASKSLSVSVDVETAWLCQHLLLGFSRTGDCQHGSGGIRHCALHGADPCAGLPEKKYLYQPEKNVMRIWIYTTRGLTTAQAIELTLQAEQAAFSTPANTSKTKTVRAFPVTKDTLFSAASNGFMGGYSPIRVTRPVVCRLRKRVSTWSATCGTPRHAIRKNWPMYGNRRDAAHRAAARLGAKKISPRSCPVLFEAPLAAGFARQLCPSDQRWRWYS